MNIDDIKNDEKSKLILVLLFKYNIFRNLNEDEFPIVYKKFQDFTSKYIELRIDEIIPLFKKEFNIEIKENNNNQITELEILREFLIQLYIRNEFLIRDTLRLVNTNSKRLIQSILSEVNRNSINTFKKEIENNKKIESLNEKIEDIELNLEDNLKLDTLNFSEIFEVKMFLRDYIEDNKKLNYIYEKIKEKLDCKINERISEIGLNNFINEKNDIDKNMILSNIVLFFKKNNKTFIECLERGLSLECFREKVLQILENYIFTIDMLDNINFEEKVDNLNLDIYNENLLEYYFDINLFRKDFNKIFEEFIDFLLINEELFFKILEYFNTQENFKDILEKYYSFENTKRRFENV